jgi:ABC-type uncharacterized transport system permease subunit
MELIPNFWAYQAAFGLHLAAVALFIAYAIKPQRALSLAATVCLSVASVLLGAFLIRLGIAEGGLPLSSGFGALSFWSLSLTVLVLGAEWRYQLGLLGAFLAPLSALTLLMGFRFAKVDALPAPGLADLWLALHVALAMFGYACFTVAAGVAAAFLVQERQLKRKLLGSLTYQLPALADLESLAGLFGAIGAQALGSGLMFGFMWKHSLGQALGLSDPKVIFGILVWMAYTGIWQLRAQGALRGRRFAYLLLLFFLLLLPFYSFSLLII